jgi:hypothetical protein
LGLRGVGFAFAGVRVCFCCVSRPSFARPFFVSQILSLFFNTYSSFFLLGNGFSSLVCVAPLTCFACLFACQTLLLPPLFSSCRPLFPQTWGWNPPPLRYPCFVSVDIVAAHNITLIPSPSLYALEDESSISYVSVCLSVYLVSMPFFTRPRCRDNNKYGVDEGGGGS